MNDLDPDRTQIRTIRSYIRTVSRYTRTASLHMVFGDEEQGQIETQPMKSNQPSLPANRAFVVQLHAEAQVEQGEFRGRVEHIVSMQATHFSSLEELAAFMVKVVTSLPEDETDI